MAIGTAKWFSDQKGYGSITPDEAGRDLFVHQSAIVGGGFRSRAEGAKVSYDIEQDPAGGRERPADLARGSPRAPGAAAN